KQTVQFSQNLWEWWSASKSFVNGSSESDRSHRDLLRTSLSTHPANPTHLSPSGMIVFSQDHEHHELACIDALPFDGLDTDELHWLIGDAWSFKQT
ncbi:hypothetical protein ACJ73_09597, partial [Blastomyces percursus]